MPSMHCFFNSEAALGAKAMLLKNQESALILQPLLSDAIVRSEIVFEFAL